MTTDERWEHINSALDYIQKLVQEDSEFSIIVSVGEKKGIYTEGRNMFYGQIGEIAELLYRIQKSEKDPMPEVREALQIIKFVVGRLGITKD